MKAPAEALNRPPMVSFDDDGSPCRGEHCWHHRTARITPPTAMVWEAGDPTPRFDTPTQPAVTRLDESHGGGSADLDGRKEVTTWPAT